MGASRPKPQPFSALRIAFQSRAFAVAGLLIAALSTACRQSAEALGGSAQLAVRNGDALFAAFAYRFANVRRDAKFAHARPLMGKYALTPAKLLSDTSIWTVGATADSARGLYLVGSYNNGQYTFESRGNAPYPARVGDERHYMQLRQTGDDEFEWYTDVSHAIGPVHAAQVADALAAVFTAFEGRTSEDARAESRSVFPRTARHLGQLLRIDSLGITDLHDGSTAARLTLRLQPDSIRPRYPNYARYIDKYVVPSVYRVQLKDQRGATYLDIHGHDGRVETQLRAQKGSLVALDGSPRPMPDSLQMVIDFSAKFKIFRVGYSNLVAQFTIERGEHERAWLWRFTREPDWHLPLAVDKLIKTPLRRPFEGRGAELRMGIRDDLGPMSMSVRQARITVHESAIMRFLGGLGATAFGDFQDRTEAEENRFLSELFSAMRQDIDALK